MTHPTFIIARSEAGATVADLLRHRLRLSWPQAAQLVRAHRVRLNGKPCPSHAYRLKTGQRLEVLDKVPAHAPQRPAKKSGKVPIVVFADAHIVVVDKPAGITTMRHAGEAAEFGHRARRFLPPTLADILPDALDGPLGKNPRVRPVHRLDKDTTGLVVFALTVEAEKHLGAQFRAHSVERRYLAVVRGHAEAGRIESCLVRDRGDGRRGSSSAKATGQHAVTHVRLVEQLDGFTVVECRLETGRTHQVRIHLGEAGTPLCGERLYDRPLHGKPVPDGSGFQRPALHAASLGFKHPATGKPMAWESPLPRDMKELLNELRARGRTRQG